MRQFICENVAEKCQFASIFNVQWELLRRSVIELRAFISIKWHGNGLLSSNKIEYNNQRTFFFQWYCNGIFSICTITENHEKSFAIHERNRLAFSIGCRRIIYYKLYQESEWRDDVILLVPFQSVPESGARKSFANPSAHNDKCRFECHHCEARSDLAIIK